MIAQDIGFTRHFLKERRIHDYDRLKKMSCGTNGQARAGVIHEISGLGLGPGATVSIKGRELSLAAWYKRWSAAGLTSTKLFHFQVKSETIAGELLYHFNTLQYFHDNHRGLDSLVGPRKCSLGRSIRPNNQEFASAGLLGFVPRPKLHFPGSSIGRFEFLHGRWSVVSRGLLATL